MRHFPYNCLGLLGSDKERLVSRTDNFVNVLNSVTSPYVTCHYFLTMSVGSHFNLTFGLKPQVSGIKIVCHCMFTNDPFSKLSGS